VELGAEPGLFCDLGADGVEGAGARGKGVEFPLGGNVVVTVVVRGRIVGNET
tara:strand:+ start:1057 stop:1212 length:156 start_codon:yes stop_codon:yes gene_type:complete